MKFYAWTLMLLLCRIHTFDIRYQHDSWLCSCAVMSLRWTRAFSEVFTEQLDSAFFLLLIKDKKLCFINKKDSLLLFIIYFLLPRDCKLQALWKTVAWRTINIFSFTYVYRSIPTLSHHIQFRFREKAMFCDF